MREKSLGTKILTVIGLVVGLFFACWAAVYVLTFVLGAIIGLIAKVVVPVLVIGGAVYIGYRVFSRDKSLPGSGRGRLPRL